MSGTKKSPGGRGRKALPLPKELCLKMLDLMIKSRVLEERMIKIYKAGESYFWIGGPGEEAFGVPLGLLARKGRGHDYDYFHLHYRCSPTLIALGMPIIDAIRLMMSRATDRSTGGKNFSNHYAYPEWNVVPVSSPIEVQYGQAIGTAWAQKRERSKGISIVTGGDAGTAESDFASSLIWATRPGNELPMLITVQNNQWGISTHFSGQHGETNIADRGKAFNMRTLVINGNDPIETYLRLQDEMQYVRTKRKPVLLEAKVSRLYGHSSASGAALIPEEDCIVTFAERLKSEDWITEAEVKDIFTRYEKEARDAQDAVRDEPLPQPEDIWKKIWVGNENADWRKF